MKINSIPKRGRKGSVIYSETRHGKVAREFVPPHNPRTAAATGPPPQRPRCFCPMVHSDPGTAGCLVRCRGQQTLRERRRPPDTPQRLQLLCELEYPARRPRLCPSSISHPPSLSSAKTPWTNWSLPSREASSPSSSASQARWPNTPWYMAPRRSEVVSAMFITSRSWGCCRPRKTAGATSPSFTLPGMACRRPEPGHLDSHLPAH